MAQTDKTVGKEKLTHFEWWLCFWLAMIALNQPGTARVKVTVDGNQIEHHSLDRSISCGRGT